MPSPGPQPAEGAPATVESVHVGGGAARCAGPAAPAAATTVARLHRLVWTALLAACIVVGAWIEFPLGPVPFSLQDLFVFVAGFLLGPVRGPAAVLLYLGAGVVGGPVFAGGRGGLAALLGPTGGYLVGFVPAAAVTGLAARRDEPVSWPRGVALGVLALALVYATGALRLRAVLQLSWRGALLAGVAPFVVQDLVKVGLAVAIARFLRPRMRLAP